MKIIALIPALSGSKAIKDKKKIMKGINPNIVMKYQLKLLNLLLIEDFDLGTLPMPIVIQLTNNPKLIKAIQYSFGQGVNFKTPETSQEQKKN